ncbi:MAG: hypothetical protein EB100_06125, partial [Crocinitomicaceae bacterium]|nr:hypothetical protein [Crocinitomicaceae bacterium]
AKSLKNTDDGTVSYKWYALGSSTPIPNETNSSLKISNIDISKKGKYKCEVTVTKGALICNKNLEFDVDVIEKFTFDLGADKTMCPGTSTIELKPTIQNSNSSITYSWTSSPSRITGTSKDINVNATSIATESTLTLTAKAGNCEFSDNVKIANVSNFTVSAGSDQTVCKGDNVNLSATVSNTNGFPVSYLWTGTGGYNSSNQNVGILNLQTSSNYSIKSNVLSCEVTDNITINIIEAKLTSENMITLKGEKWLRYCMTGSDVNGVIFLKNGINSNLHSSIDSYEIDWGDKSSLFTSSSHDFDTYHVYLPGLYDLKFTVKASPNCINSVVYKVFVGSQNGTPGIKIQPDPNGCSPLKDYFKTEKDNRDGPGSLYDIEFNDGTIYSFDYFTLPDTLFHTFQKTSCGLSHPTYGENTYGVKITSRNACQTLGLSNFSMPIFISEPLKADLKSKDTICINKTLTIQDLTEAGVTVNDANCTNEYKHYWKITPLTGWSTTGKLGSTGPFSNNYSSWQRGDSQLNVVFSQPGIYQLSINAMSPSINGSGGRVCQNDVKTKTICVEGPPIPKFELDKLAGCAPFTPVISELSDISKSCKIFRKWEVFFNNNPCGVQS